MSNIFYPPRVQYDPLDKLYFFATGTTTPQNTYTDIDLSVAHDHPIDCDAEGYAPPIYLDPALNDYRFRRTTSVGAQVEQHDDIPSSSDVSSGYRAKGTAPAIIFEETDASSNNKKWRIRVNAEVLTISTGDDAEATWTDILSVGRSGNLFTSGSFTGVLTGFASGPSGDILYSKTGNIVTLSRLGAPLSGTSNANTLTMTGLPSAIQPSAGVIVSSWALDGNTLVPVNALVTGGTVIFSKMADTVTTPDSTGFATSSTKGLPIGWTLIYPVS